MKQVRINLRCSTELKTLIKRACKVSGKSMSEFILNAATNQAHEKLGGGE